MRFHNLHQMEQTYTHDFFFSQSIKRKTGVGFGSNYRIFFPSPVSEIIRQQTINRERKKNKKTTKSWRARGRRRSAFAQFNELLAHDSLIKVYLRETISCVAGRSFHVFHHHYRHESRFSVRCTIQSFRRPSPPTHTLMMRGWNGAELIYMSSCSGKCFPFFLLPRLCVFVSVCWCAQHFYDVVVSNRSISLARAFEWYASCLYAASVGGVSWRPPFIPPARDSRRVTRKIKPKRRWRWFICRERESEMETMKWDAKWTPETKFAFGEFISRQFVSSGREGRKLSNPT